MVEFHSLDFFIFQLSVKWDYFPTARLWNLLNFGNNFQHAMFVICSINLEEQCLAWGIFLKIEMLKLRPHIIRYIIGSMNFSSWLVPLLFSSMVWKIICFSCLGFWWGLEDFIQGVWSSFPKGPNQIVPASDKDVYSLYGCKNETLMKIIKVLY
jgi:hypothetical protein